MKNYQVILMSLFSVCLFYSLGSAFLTGLDKQIASECATYPSRDYCEMYTAAQSNENSDQLLVAKK